MSVTIIIKSATQMVDDFSLDCDLTWTIGRVKEKLEESYPNNPKKESQKLIYGGKLLPDHLSLKSVLNHSQERHILHLVCPCPSNVNTKSSEQPAPQSFPVPPINPTFAPLNQPILNPPSFSSMPGVTVTPLNPADSFQQYLAMQQMYAQCMAQYLSQYNGGVPPTIPIPPVIPPVQTPQVPPPQQNLNPIRPRRRAEDEDRDYLDYLYIISRAVMLFAVLYYYSSLSRVLVVVSMFLCISMYIKVKRIFQRQQDIQRLRNERQRAESVPSQQIPADIQTTEIEEPIMSENVAAESSGNEGTVPDASPEDNTSDVTLSHQTEERSLLTVISTTVSLISAFFSSLIPSDPVPVNIN